MHDRQNLRERRYLDLVERANLAVAVEQCTSGTEVKVDPPLACEIQPVDGASFERNGEVVHGEGAIGETEVEHANHGCVRACRAPCEIGGVPISVPPLRCESGEDWRDPFGRDEVMAGEVVEEST